MEIRKKRLTAMTSYIRGLRHVSILLGEHTNGMFKAAERLIHPKAQPGGAEGAQAPPLAIRILMFIFLVFHQHCKSRSGALQNILWQYHKA